MHRVMLVKGTADLLHDWVADKFARHLKDHHSSVQRDRCNCNGIERAPGHRRARAGRPGPARQAAAASEYAALPGQAARAGVPA
jgi:hypothetical protein